MIAQDLLKILCCPETQQALHLADTALIDKVNRRIGSAQQRNRGGEVVTQPLEGGLVREDAKCLYPIRQKLPILLVDEALSLED